MKAVAYSTKFLEKVFLAKANTKKHDITLISNSLSLETALYAEGKEAVLIYTQDDASAPVLDKLYQLGVKYLATRSVGCDHIDLARARALGIRVARVPGYPAFLTNMAMKKIAETTIYNLDCWKNGTVNDNEFTLSE
jgi:D-lactate dehydrogenase